MASDLRTLVNINAIATMLGISGGCEPEFALSYKRKTENLKESYDVCCKSVNEYWELTDNTIDKNNINSLPNYFVTAKDIHWKQRIEAQAAMQDYVDTAISSTINLPSNITLDEIEQIYLYAWEKGLKGVTVFRDGCSRAAILNTPTSTKKDKEEVATKQKSTVIPRGAIITADDNVVGLKRKLITGCGSLHCLAFFDPVTGDLLETYLNKGSTGGCNNFMIGLSRMISLLVRAGVDIETIVDQLNSCGACPSYAARTATKHDTSKGACCPMAIGNALLDMYKEMQQMIKCNDSTEDTEEEERPVTKTVEHSDSAKCPECGETLIFEGGCVSCKGCGWSRCG